MKLLITLAPLALLTITAAAAQDRPAITAIVPEGTETTVERFGYSPAVRAGDYVYLAGVVAGIPDDVEPSDEALKDAYRRAMIAIARVLEDASASWDHVVDMTTYHTDLRGQGEAFMAVKTEFVTEPYPAWTAIDIDRLWPDGGLTEIKVVAYAPLAD